MKLRTTQADYNKCVETVYYKILKQAKQQLAPIDHDELRYSLIRKDEHILHEFVNPLCYLRLECHTFGLYNIHFGVETFDHSNPYSQITSFIVRSIFSLTSKEMTEINIEGCVHTDWIITNTSELYAHIEERNEHHTFTLIKYKPRASKRKQMRAVA